MSELLENHRDRGLATTLRTIKTHSNIRGNDLADEEAKLAVTDLNTLSPDQTIRVEVGSIAPHPF